MAAGRCTIDTVIAILALYGLEVDTPGVERGDILPAWPGRLSDRGRVQVIRGGRQGVGEEAVDG